MSPTKTQPPNLAMYGGKDPRNIPAYTFGDASKYLDIPLATLRSWALGRKYPTKSGSKLFKAVFQLPNKTPQLLSFTNLVESHVLNALRKEYKIDLKKVRRTLRYLETSFGYAHPLSDQKFQTDGIDIFIDYYGDLINASQEGQLGMKAILEKFLSRIEHNPAGQAARLYPFLRAQGFSDNKSIVIDPYVSFGKPVITGTGVSTSIVFGRFNAGESVDHIAKDYGRQTFEIEEAIRYESAA